MASVIVVRFDGDRQGEPIVEPLAATESVLIARGTKEINDKSLDGVERTVEIPYVEDMFVGAIVRLNDETLGQTFVGKVTAFDHMFQEGTQKTNLVVMGVVK